jgi:hypothetical protein
MSMLVFHIRPNRVKRSGEEKVHSLHLQLIQEDTLLTSVYKASTTR